MANTMSWHKTNIWGLILVGWLLFGPMVSTRMACPDGMDLERQFLGGLAQLARYRICENILELLDTSCMVIAQFKTDHQ